MATKKAPSVRVTKKLVEEICNSSLRQYVEGEIAKMRAEMKSSTEGLMNRVMTDRKRNEEMIEGRTTFHPMSVEMAKWKEGIIDRVAEMHERISARESRWMLFLRQCQTEGARRRASDERRAARLSGLECRLSGLDVVELRRDIQKLSKRLNMHVAKSKAARSNKPAKRVR